MSDCLSRLLFPHDRSLFLDCYRQRKHFHIARNDASFYTDILTLGDIEAVIQSGNHPAAFVNVIRNGKRYPLKEWSHRRHSARGSCRVVLPEQMFKLYMEGATLVLNRLDRSVPSLNLLSRQLMA